MKTIKTNSKYSNIVNKIDEKEVIELYINKKLGSSAISKIYNCLSCHIIEILKRNNIVMYKKNNIPGKEVINLYLQNYSLKEIADKYNINKGTIKKFLIKNNIKIKIKSNRIDNKECCWMYEKGFSLTKLSNKYNVCPETIKKILKKKNIKIRTKGNSKIQPTYNMKANSFFKYFDQLNNIKGFYGENEFYIKELGYFPDYINFDLKLIIEWDEKHHKYKINEDEKRQEKIQKLYPNFKFRRIND